MPNTFKRLSWDELLANLLTEGSIEHNRDYDSKGAKGKKNPEYTLTEHGLYQINHITFDGRHTNV